MHTADEADSTGHGVSSTATPGENDPRATTANNDDSNATVTNVNEGEEEEVDSRMFTDIFSSSRPKDALDGTWKGAGNVLKGIFIHSFIGIHNFCM